MTSHRKKSFKEVTIPMKYCQFDYPFKDYPKHGNYVEVRIGSTYIDKAR